jgi:DNA-binding beta-propeller fold protein YncE
MGLLLVLTRKEDIEDRPRSLGFLGTLAAVVFMVVIAGNIVQAFASTGPPPFMGQSDPVRFSFSPKHWVWSLEEWSRAPISLRGRWAIDKPSLDGLPAGSGGPIANAPVVPVARESKVGFPLAGTPTDLAFDPATSQFLITTEHGVYLTDEMLGKLNRYAIVDAGFAVDLGRFAGAAFLDKGIVLAVGENKSFVVLDPSDKADAEANFRFFLESFDTFEERSRSRFGTVRARMMYVMSAAYDSTSNSVYTVTVPNHKVKRLIISRFDGNDMTLSEEFAPTLAKDAGLTLEGKQTLNDFYVTGATIASGRMYAISAAFNTLLTIDLQTHEVTSARVIAGLERPVGIAAKGDELYILGQSGRVWVVDRK